LHTLLGRLGVSITRCRLRHRASLGLTGFQSCRVYVCVCVCVYPLHAPLSV